MNHRALGILLGLAVPTTGIIGVNTYVSRSNTAQMASENYQTNPAVASLDTYTPAPYAVEIEQPTQSLETVVQQETTQVQPDVQIETQPNIDNLSVQQQYDILTQRHNLLEGIPANGNYATNNPANESDLMLLARTLYGEARSDSIEGQLAVAYVVLNRQENPRLYGQTLNEIMLRNNGRTWQFDCFRPGTPNYRRTLQATDDEAFEQCYQVANIALQGLIDDPTNGANLYHVSSMRFPSTWDPNVLENKGIIGSHRFYEE